MGETTRQIATHIEHTREDLGSNLEELEQKVKSVTDWRQQFQNSPGTMVGLAFGGGVILAAIARGRRNRLSGMSSPASVLSPSGPGDTASGSRRAANREMQQVLETWNNIRGALVGVAVARIKDFLGDSIPGFQEHLQRTEGNLKAPLPSRPASNPPSSASFAT
jgi:hypothetical protein